MLCIRRRKSSLAALVIAVLAAAPVGADQSDDQYAVAAGHYSRQQWEFAAEEFETFLDVNPHHRLHDQAVFFLAETLVQLGRYDEAGTRFRQYLAMAPGGQFARSALFRAGETAYLSGKFTLAREKLDAFLTRYPQDPLNAYVLAYLGDLALNAGDAPQAESHYRIGLERFPQSRPADECRFGLARALEKLGRGEEAGRLYLALAAKTNPPLADDAQFHLGSLQYASGQFEEAAATFDAFESRFPRSDWLPTVCLAHGWALWKLDRLDAAAEQFHKILSDPKLGAEARYWLGLTEKSRKDWKAAAATFLAALEDAPEHELAPALRFQAGDALMHADDLATAREHFDRVISDSPPGSEWIDDALRGAVQAALLEKDHEAVEGYAAEFQSRFSDSPLLPDVLRLLARSLIERKEYGRADAMLKPLVSDGVDEPSAEDRYVYALVCQGLGRHEEALSALDAVAASAGDRGGRIVADAQLARASLLVNLKRFAEAIEPLESFLATGPQAEPAAQARAQLAVCYARSGRMDEAREAHRQILDGRPDPQLLGQAVEQLAEAAYDAGDLGWASELFAWLTAQGEPGRFEPRGLSGLAWSQYKAGQREEAAATFDRLLENDPDGPAAAEAALARGRILQEMGRSDAALAMYDRVIERHPKSRQLADALWAAAQLRDRLAQDREAVSLYERLATEFPDFPRIDALLYNWAWSLCDAGRADESYARFERIQKEHPKSEYWADATFRLAQHAFKTGDTARAKTLAELALVDGPLSKEAGIRENFLYLKGQILAADENWQEARKAFETLLADYPRSQLGLMAEYGVAEAVFRQGDYAEAAGLLQSLVSKTQDRDEPWLAMAHLRLAQSLAHEKQWTEALAIASQIQKRFPGFADQYEADYVIGRSLAGRADFDAAREAYRKAIQSPAGEKTETAAKSQLMIAESYFHQKNYAAALRDYLRLEILYGYPELQAAALLQAAKCHELLGESQQAAELIARLLKAYPQTTAAAEAARRPRATASQAAVR
jgi:TolA-binding protein